MLFATDNFVIDVRKYIIKDGEHMNFAQELKSLRKERGLTQEALARNVGSTREKIQKYEEGVNPPVETLIKLADALGVCIDHLVRGGDGCPVKNDEIADLVRRIVTMRETNKQVVKKLLDALEEGTK
ncbi:MAG TPA: helix-turn-helix transcriptional regulator [Bacillota bacterium]|nr:helix-turn-helix transcriptional regulator [Bacillota bacterium]